MTQSSKLILREWIYEVKHLKIYKIMKPWIVLHEWKNQRTSNNHVQEYILKNSNSFMKLNYREEM